MCNLISFDVNILYSIVLKVIFGAEQKVNTLDLVIAQRHILETLKRFEEYILQFITIKVNSLDFRGLNLNGGKIALTLY